MARRPAFPQTPVIRWTPRAAVRSSAARLERASLAVREVALLWGDVDEALVERAEELARDIETFSAEIRDTVEERLAAGETIGL